MLIYFATIDLRALLPKAKLVANLIGLYELTIDMTMFWYSVSTLSFMVPWILTNDYH